MKDINAKYIIVFNTNITKIYKIEGERKSLLKEQQLFFNETLINDELFNKIDKFLFSFKSEEKVNDVNQIRIYAIGIFQEFSFEEQMQLRIYIYGTQGIYFNIVQKDLENFYLKQSFLKSGKESFIEGVTIQEFRKVVICGSFQKNMLEINNLIKLLNQYHIEVLSPWTNKIVPETIGTDFILLEGQVMKNKRDSWRHKYDHMNKFIKADAIIVCNPEGLIGKGTMFEFGFMVANAKRIIFTNEPKELSILFPYEVGLNFN